MPDPLRDVFQALERAPPPKVEEMQSSVAKSVDSFAKEAEKLSPFTMIGEQTKNQVKGALKSNWPRIVIGFFEVSLYCALYHHATEEIKKRTKHRRRLHRALSYTFDIVLPAPIYAPIFGFLVRLALPI